MTAIAAEALRRLTCKLSSRTSRVLLHPGSGHLSTCSSPPEGLEAQAPLSTRVRRLHVVPCGLCACPLALLRLLVGRGTRLYQGPKELYCWANTGVDCHFFPCRGSSRPRFQTRVSGGSCTGRQILSPPSTWESYSCINTCLKANLSVRKDGMQSQWSREKTQEITGDLPVNTGSHRGKERGVLQTGQ